MVDTNHSHIIFASSLSCTLYFCIAKIAKRLACNFIFLFIAILISFLLAMKLSLSKPVCIYRTFFSIQNIWRPFFAAVPVLPVGRYSLGK